MIRRYDDWPERLTAFIEGRRRVPFIWGINDCGAFACSAVEVMTGVDLRAGLAPYSDIESARVAMGGGLEQFAEQIAAQFGIEQISVKFAGRGDLALHTSLGGIVLGVVSMAGTEILAPGIDRAGISPEIPAIVEDGDTTEYHYEQSGICSLPLLSCSRAWRIG